MRECIGMGGLKRKMADVLRWRFMTVASQRKGNASAKRFWICLSASDHDFYFSH